MVYPCGRTFGGIQLHSIVSGDGPCSSTLVARAFAVPGTTPIPFGNGALFVGTRDGSCTCPAGPGLAALYLEPTLLPRSNSMVPRTHIGRLLCPQPPLIFLGGKFPPIQKVGAGPWPIPGAFPISLGGLPISLGGCVPCLGSPMASFVGLCFRALAGDETPQASWLHSSDPPGRDRPCSQSRGCAFR